MSHDDPIRLNRMNEHITIAPSAETDILRPQGIQCLNPNLQAAQNVVVEVFVDEKPQHDCRYSRVRSSRRARIPETGDLLSLSARTSAASASRSATYASTASVRSR